MWLPREDGPNESRPSARSSSSYRQIQGPAPPATPARRRRWAGRRQAGQQLSTCCHLSPTAPALDCWPCSAWRTRQRADMSRLIFDTQALADPGTRRQLYRSVAAATRKLCTRAALRAAREHTPQSTGSYQAGESAVARSRCHRIHVCASPCLAAQRLTTAALRATATTLVCGKLKKKKPDKSGGEQETTSLVTRVVVQRQAASCLPTCTTCTP